MLTIERRADGVLHVFADGQLTTEDFEGFVPRFDALAGDWPRPMLVELGASFSGWSLGGLWNDLKFDFHHRQQFGRIAVLGDKFWQKRVTEAWNPLFPGEMRYFEAAKRDEAEQWLRGGEE